ncbi:acetylornithine transaminase [uncultured Nitrospira sp.]|uniref:acetylornithine transaminase n=1 Tax=uncultured Nitrospira sp. TaxID=157176 RepID=UPI003140298C
MITSEFQKNTGKYLMDTYTRLPISLVRGNGCLVYDAEGREYVDCLAGIAVNILGHAHPDLVDAIIRQARQLIHTSNLFYTEPQIRLAQRLVELSFADKVFFCNSGTEANEAAIKLARRYAHNTFGPERFEILTMVNSFHGRTLASLTATGQPKLQEGFGPLVPGFRYVPFNDLEAVKANITPQTAAVMVEPIQAEGGVIVPNPSYLKGLREFCTEQQILLIFDEVQTGMGRTGTLFAYEQFGIQPDIMTLAKGLGGGIPIGACLATDTIAAAFEPGTHASTFGGNPLACAVALKVLDLLIEGGKLEQGRLAGRYLAKGLSSLNEKFSCIQEVRGKGLLQGLELTIDGKPLVLECLERRVLINCTMGRVLRFVPPLIISNAQIDRLLSVLSEVLSKHR